MRKRILERAGGCCERCRVPNHRTVKRWRGWWALVAGSDLAWHDAAGVAVLPAGFTLPKQRIVYIVLTVAHLDHTPGNDTEENLRAFCQWCHLHHDLAEHRASRCSRKDRGRPLLEGSGGVGWSSPDDSKFPLA